MITSKKRLDTHSLSGMTIPKMKMVKVLAVSFLGLVGQVCVADTAAEKEAKELLDSMNMDAVLDQTVSQMLDIQLQQNPALLPYKDVMMKFFHKHMSYEVLRPELVEVYADAFTAEELQEINAFYRTETGQKTISLFPQLSAKGAQIGAERVQQNIGELQSMIQSEAERIKQLQAH